MQANAVLHALHAGCGADQGLGGTTPAPHRKSAPSGPQSEPTQAPAELLHFLRVHTPTEAAAALGLDRATVYRLSKGYWPAKPQRLLLAWHAYTGRTGALASSWFLRRVRDGGLVAHSGGLYTALDLSARAGQLVAVAREAGGGLLAQTLDIPVLRLPLVPLQRDQVATP